ncbi:MAG TPA: hypothetical protein VHU80_19185 [Polyangiaceae bacterium]|jgi:hypothetical protein|nr:hypothetical protein [Polyangiaceae bacterium]
MATRTVVLLAYGLVAMGVASACASEETPSTFRQDAGVCNVAFCTAPAGATPCCLTTTTCGVDLGTGCVPLKKDGGSQ